MLLLSLLMLCKSHSLKQLNTQKIQSKKVMKAQILIMELSRIRRILSSSRLKHWINQLKNISQSHKDCPKVLQFNSSKTFQWTLLLTWGPNSILKCILKCIHNTKVSHLWCNRSICKCNLNNIHSLIRWTFKLLSSPTWTSVPLSSSLTTPSSQQLRNPRNRVQRVLKILLCWKIIKTLWLRNLLNSLSHQRSIRLLIRGKILLYRMLKWRNHSSLS